MLGVGGTVAVGSASIDDVREAVTGQQSNELASVGEAIRDDLAGSVNADLLTQVQRNLAVTASDLPAVVDRGLPTDVTEPREEFTPLAEAVQPAYDHLVDVGFFESTSENLPEFTPAYIEESVRRFVATDSVANLEELGFSKQEQVDLLATVASHRERIGDRHWVTTDKLKRGDVQFAEEVPPMTKAATGGALLWLEDLDHHLWQKALLLTDDILADATWDARAMAAGIQLVTEGARHIAEQSETFADDELAGVLSSGYALQAVAQNLLREDAYWLTEEKRADRTHEDIALPGGDSL